jgi:hypothetical protein
MGVPAPPSYTALIRSALQERPAPEQQTVEHPTEDAREQKPRLKLGRRARRPHLRFCFHPDEIELAEVTGRPT